MRRRDVTDEDLKRVEDSVDGTKRILVKLDKLSDDMVAKIETRGIAYGDDRFGRTGLYDRRYKIIGREHPVIVEQYRRDYRTVTVFLQVQRTISQVERQLRKLIRQGGGPGGGSKVVVRFLNADNPDGHKIGE